MRFSIAYLAIAILALRSTVTSMPTPVDSATLDKDHFIQMHTLHALSAMNMMNTKDGSPAKINQHLTQEVIDLLKSLPPQKLKIRFKEAPFFPKHISWKVQEAHERVKKLLTQVLGHEPDLDFDPEHEYSYGEVTEGVQEPLHYTVIVAPDKEFRVASSFFPENGHPVVIMQPVDAEHSDYPSFYDMLAQRQLLRDAARSGPGRAQGESSSRSK
ncbi:hypothetical protein F5878DRAFT_602488 [Lentinula raphanica]|uniref:Uncharacterized protein n=1 Tax=Lentinula raphanica TaxID=153919 RepID=A0AA38UJN2_9AGAR|nr:hypothetical protein F5878DRAFT_602488 [Lentinula raphanica]